MKNNTQDYPELTFAAIALGIIQGIVMTAAFVYAGLKLGFTLGGSTIAAIMGFALLKGVLGRGTIVENNINQTIASGINTTGSGIIFTLPVLYMMGVDFNSYYILMAAIAGSFLGVVVIIPLRKQMIDFDRLRFPSGTAVAAILKSPGAGREKAILLISGCLLSFLCVVAVKFKIIPEEISLNWIFNFPEYTQTAIWVSLMNIGAGLLAGRGGLSFAFGGILAFWFLGPLGVHLGYAPANLAGPELTNFVYGNWLRPLGIGMLIGGALMGVIIAFPAMKSAFASLAKAAKSGKTASREEMSVNIIYIGIFLSIITLFMVSYLGVKGITFGKAFQISLIGSVWIALAGIIVAQCTGLTDISPLSGLSLIAVTIMMALTNSNEFASILIGVAVCVAIAQCADMMQDLKTGYLIGGIPVRQQWVQIAVAWIGPIIAMLTLSILWHVPPVTRGAATAAIKNLDKAVAENLVKVDVENVKGYTYVKAEIKQRVKRAKGDTTPIPVYTKEYRINIKDGYVEEKVSDLYKKIGQIDVKKYEKKYGSHGFGEGTKLPAPQAGALKGMISGIKSGNVPLNKYVTGSIIGALLTLLPISGLGVMIGLAMYLPFSITLGYGIGCLISLVLEGYKGIGWCEDKVVPFAAGLIIGEAMTELTYSSYLIFFG